MDGTSIIIGIVAVAVIIYQIWGSFFGYAGKCSGRLRFDSQSNSMGTNISKIITTSFWKGPRKMTYVWKCKKCGEVLTETNWEID